MKRALKSACTVLTAFPKLHTSLFLNNAAVQSWWASEPICDGRNLDDVFEFCNGWRLLGLFQSIKQHMGAQQLKALSAALVDAIAVLKEQPKEPLWKEVRARVVVGVAASVPLSEAVQVATRRQLLRKASARARSHRVSHTLSPLPTLLRL